MSEEIVRRLRNRSKKDLNFLKESLNNISEAEEDEEDKDIQEPEEDIDDSPELEDTDDEEETPEDDEYVDPEGEIESDTDNIEDEDSGEYINPLDNVYAVKHTIGDKVLLAYSNGTNSKLKGEIDGYDKEGFYRIKWSNGLTTNGITDLALSDLVSSKHESKCVCGSSKFVNEGKSLICDRCGRRIKESMDPLTLADKSRPKGKKMIRSEAHPVSTVIKPAISESIRKAFKSNLKEGNDEYIIFYKLKELEGEFWTRLSELKEDIEELGYSVDEINSEYVVVSITDEEDNDYGLLIPISGTSRTITLDLDKARNV